MTDDEKKAMIERGWWMPDEEELLQLEKEGMIRILRDDDETLPPGSPS